jgi:hypothetical protein
MQTGMSVLDVLLCCYTPDKDDWLSSDDEELLQVQRRVYTRDYSLSNISLQSSMSYAEQNPGQNPDDEFVRNYDLKEPRSETQMRDETVSRQQLEAARRMLSVRTEEEAHDRSPRLFSMQATESGGDTEPERPQLLSESQLKNAFGCYNRAILYTDDLRRKRRIIEEIERYKDLYDRENTFEREYAENYLELARSSHSMDVSARVSAYQRAITFTHLLKLKEEIKDEYRKFFYTAL